LLLSSRKESFIEFLGYVLVNLTVLPKCRKFVVDEGVAKLFPLVRQDDHPARKEIAVDIIRNVSFDHDVHAGLLDADDEFLTAILAPLADEADQLDDEDIAKLPLALQYYDKKRDTNENLRLKIVETLYQLCATRHGRETLRAKGVYALLRELDKASRPDAHKPIVTDHNNALHAVIGVLIRTEAEMEVPSDVHSIRDLVTEES
ncbi:Protein Y54H5A.2, partial [Aphelenchoides avenae]